MHNSKSRMLYKTIPMKSSVTQGEARFDVDSARTARLRGVVVGDSAGSLPIGCVSARIEDS